MKTVGEWYNEIQDPEIAKNARRAMIKQGRNIQREVESLSQAINYILWSDTEQGQDYWSRIKTNIEHGELV